MAATDPAGAERDTPRVTIAIVTLLLIASVALRLWRLDTLPGINGDEAWYGVQMLNLMDGQTFEGRTPPGNLLNPFFSGLVLLVQLPLAPDFWILRAPAVISTLLAVVACAVLWRFVSTPLTLVAALLFATLPVTIAYGRFGWDASQSVLAGVLFIFCLMKRRWLLAGLCFVAAVWVHPTNVFLAPLIFIHFAYERPFDARTFAIKSAAALVIVFAAKQFFVPPNVQLTAAAILGRVLSPETWGLFIVRFGRLFSGATSYTYIAGPLSPGNQYAHDAVFWLIAILVTLFGIVGIIKEADPTGRTHTVGWAAMVLTFFALAGPDALAPHFERYALVLVAPTALTFVLLLGHTAGQWKMQRHLLTAGAALAAACLVSFYLNYVQVLATTGGDSHRTFRTSDREPKAAALDWIRTHSASRADCVQTQIVAEDWWTYWPLRYLAYREPKFSVVMTSNEATAQFFGNSSGCSYLVGFAGGELETVIAQRNTALNRETITDPLDRPILFVWTNR